MSILSIRHLKKIPPKVKIQNGQVWGYPPIFTQKKCV